MTTRLVTVVSLAFALVVAGAAHAGWDREIVDAEGDVGLYTSLAFDQLGSPCISYHDDTNGTLRVACKTGDVWSVERVLDEEQPVGDYSSLAIEVDGTLHVAYRRGSDVLSVLKYAKRSGSVWQIETVDTQAQGVGHRASLAVDAAGSPHIAHAKSWGSQSVKYATWTGSSWDRQTVTKQGAAAIDLVLTEGGSPRIVFQGQLGSVHLARLTGNGKWKLDTLGPACGMEQVGLAIHGEVHHVVYGEGESCDLRYATWTELDGWRMALEPVDVGLAPQDGWLIAWGVSLAADASGGLHLSYYHGDEGALKYAHKPAGGGWTTPEVVDAASDQVGGYSSIALDGAGNPHISYYDGLNGDLRYASYASTCASNADCDDLNDCTDDLCDLGACVNTPSADETICGLGAGVCCGGSCSTPLCSADADCDDWNACTTDICYDAMTCTAYCDSGATICDCDAYRDRGSCNADADCVWSNRSKVCEPR